MKPPPPPPSLPFFLRVVIIDSSLLNWTGGAGVYWTVVVSVRPASRLCFSLVIVDWSHQPTPLVSRKLFFLFSTTVIVSVSLYSFIYLLFI